MKFEYRTITHQTEKMLDIIDITDEIKDFVENQNIKNGLVNIQSMHTTTSLILNENEPLLLGDMKENLQKVANAEDIYSHDNFTIRTVNMCEGECKNGHSHCKAIYLSPNVTLNLIDGKIQFGEWQRVLFIELDRSRSRHVQILIMGV